MAAQVGHTGWQSAYGFHLDDWEFGDSKLTAKVNRNHACDYIPGYGTARAVRAFYKTAKNSHPIAKEYVLGVRVRAAFLLVPIVGPLFVLPVDVAVTSVRTYRSHKCSK